MRDRFEELGDAIRGWFDRQGWPRPTRPASSDAFNRDYQVWTTAAGYTLWISDEASSDYRPPQIIAALEQCRVIDQLKRGVARDVFVLTSAGLSDSPTSWRELPSWCNSGEIAIAVTARENLGIGG